MRLNKLAIMFVAIAMTLASCGTDAQDSDSTNAKRIEDNQRYEAMKRAKARHVDSDTAQIQRTSVETRQQALEALKEQGVSCEKQGEALKRERDTVVRKGRP